MLKFLLFPGSMDPVSSIGRPDGRISTVTLVSIRMSGMILFKVLRTNGSESVVLIAHSLGCHLVAKSYPIIKKWTRGIFFVAPPNLDSEALRKDLSSFKSAKSEGFECVAWLIYSEDDPFASVPYSKSMGDTLRMKTFTVGKRGHINSDSNIGNWDEGSLLFNQMLKMIF
jgi:predicted alpha/beta hydrolase family esterase